MQMYVAVTDYEWYQFLSSRAPWEEVNFWKPSPDKPFKALPRGGLFLFKLKAPRNAIAGGGFFAGFLHLPVLLAWQAFEKANGVASLDQLQRLVDENRRWRGAVIGATTIGCILLQEPFFFSDDNWILAPASFRPKTVSGKGYDAGDEEGAWLFQEVSLRLQWLAPAAGSAEAGALQAARYGSPMTVTSRLGQASFRALVAEAYGRRCAITEEKTLPVLEAAHVKPYAAGGEHRLDNGLFLRSDLHTLFDLGYLTVDPDDRRVVVSGRIREEFENGRHYYELHGRPIAMPVDVGSSPARENLLYHAQTIFR